MSEHIQLKVPTGWVSRLRFPTEVSYASGILEKDIDILTERKHWLIWRLLKCCLCHCTEAWRMCEYLVANWYSKCLS